MPGYQRVKGSNVWLKYHAGWVRPEQFPAPFVPGQPPLSRCSAQHGLVGDCGTGTATGCSRRRRTLVRPGRGR